MPPLTPEEYSELEESIRANGVIVQVVTDEHGTTIDGYNRSEIADRLGIDCPKQVRAGLTEQEKRTLAFELNLNRRHLNREQKRILVANSLIADPQLSDREHARRTGVSHPTVAAVRRELEQTGDVENLSTRTDALGREQPVPARERPGFVPDHDCPNCGDHHAYNPVPESDEEFLARLMSAERRFTVPATAEELIAHLAQIAEEERRLKRIKFETEIAALPVKYPDDPVMRDAVYVGMTLRYYGSVIQDALDGGMTIEEFAEAAGVRVEIVQDHLDAFHYQPGEEE